MNTPEQRLEILYRARFVAFWAFNVLRSRQAENLTEAAYIEAKLRVKGKAEGFHYETVLFSQQPSVEIIG